MELAPIIIFTYNRPDKTLSVINSLKTNNLAKYSDLYIFSDGPNKFKKDDFYKVNCIQEIIKNTDGFKSIKFIQSSKNLGLYRNITLGLDYIFKKNKKAIVLVDKIRLYSGYKHDQNVIKKIYFPYIKVLKEILEKDKLRFNQTTSGESENLFIRLKSLVIELLFKIKTKRELNKYIDLNKIL